MRYISCHRTLFNSHAILDIASSVRQRLTTYFLTAELCMYTPGLNKTQLWSDFPIGHKIEGSEYNWPQLKKNLI
jgi:hypothetical protein